MIEQYIDMANQIIKSVEKNTELISGLAKIYRRLYLELKNCGFSEEQSMQIMINLKLK